MWYDNLKIIIINISLSKFNFRFRLAVSSVEKGVVFNIWKKISLQYSNISVIYLLKWYEKYKYKSVGTYVPI